MSLTVVIRGLPGITINVLRNTTPIITVLIIHPETFLTQNKKFSHSYSFLKNIIKFCFQSWKWIFKCTHQIGGHSSIEPEPILIILFDLNLRKSNLGGKTSSSQVLYMYMLYILDCRKAQYNSQEDWKKESPLFPW